MRGLKATATPVVEVSLSCASTLDERMAGTILPQLRVVAIGGGTGLSTLLLGLKRYVATPGSPTGFDRRGGSRSRNTKLCPDAPCLIRELAAVVTVTDDGGSSGRLREAIRLNDQNRLQARSDSDFESVAEDPRFTELLYPEA